MLFEAGEQHRTSHMVDFSNMQAICGLIPGQSLNMVNPLGVCNLEGGCVCDVKIFDKATFNESPLPPNVLQV